MGKIILTDYPQLKYMKANLRGMTSGDLVEKGKELFHLMMTFGNEKCCGWVLEFTPEDIEKELKWRKDDRLRKYINGE